MGMHKGVHDLLGQGRQRVGWWGRVIRGPSPNAFSHCLSGLYIAPQGVTQPGKRESLKIKSPLKWTLAAWGLPGYR